MIELLLLDDTLRCHLCNGYFKQCVITRCSHSFCNSCITDYAAHQHQCPECFKVINLELDVIPNDVVNAIILLYYQIKTVLDSKTCQREFHKDSHNHDVQLNESHSTDVVENPLSIDCSKGTASQSAFPVSIFGNQQLSHPSSSEDQNRFRGTVNKDYQSQNQLSNHPVNPVYDPNAQENTKRGCKDIVNNHYPISIFGNSESLNKAAESKSSSFQPCTASMLSDCQFQSTPVDSRQYSLNAGNKDFQYEYQPSYDANYSFENKTILHQQEENMIADMEFASSSNATTLDIGMSIDNKKRKISLSHNMQPILMQEPSLNDMPQYLLDFSENFVSELNRMEDKFKCIINEIQKSCTEKLETMSLKIKYYGDCLNILERKHAKISQTVSNSNALHEIFMKFPLKTLSDQEALEKCLTSKESMDILVSTLRIIGDGKCEYGCLFNIIQRVLSDNVAVCFAYTGYNEKKSFKNLHLNTAIFRTLKLHWPLLTDKKIAHFISLWLHHSSRRLQIAQNSEIKNNMQRANVAERT